MRTPTFSWSFLIPIILSISLSVEIYGASGQCPSDQQSLLLQLKNSLVFDTAVSEINLVDWNQSTDCCSWHGVSCHEGRVIGLCLSNKSIIAGIEDSSLFHLQYLKSLDLSFNNFSNTPIPASFGKLTNLRYLNLSTAGFVGQIPIEISRLTNLVTLDISAQWLLQNPQLRLQNPNLSVLVQDLSKLEELYLDGVNISARGSDWCPALSSSLPNLRVLSLSDCSLSGPIDHSLEKLHSLSVIILNGNKLFASVAGFIAKFSNLTSLSLVDCELNGTFPKEIFQVPTLQIIDITYNILLQGSLPEFPTNSALQIIALSSTNFSGSLPTSIRNIKKLSILKLSNCLFNGRIPISVSKLTQLVYLDLSINNFTGPIPSFKMSKNLTTLDLSDNSLTGAISVSDWEGLLKLVHLRLRNNLLSGIIPSSLFAAFPSLEKIVLSYNQFHGQLPEFQNASLSILNTLDLSSNNLEGPIPVSIFKLRDLTVLSLAFNKLNNTIEPDMIQGLCSLKHLDLSYNNLSFNATGNHSTWSSFPKVSTLNLASCKLTSVPNLKNHSNLVNLDLSDNQIHGQIPNWIWEIGNGSLAYLNLSHNYLVGVQEPYSIPNYLNTLDLHFNQIHGKIPVLPAFSSYIDFSDNKFTSLIPTDTGNNSFFGIIFLSLSKNGLTGIIPKSMCNAYSEVLDLSYNGLSGIIPSCLIERVDTLGVLDLRSNNFSGAIPDAFLPGCSLKTLDLNGNSIQGKIPRSLAYCKESEVIDIGNNNLIDKFPCFLMNISTLRVLVLRSNKFHGSIECSANTNGSWEMLQIIDLAHNNFSGQLPARSLANWKAMIATNEIEPNLTHLQFQVLKFSQIYYQDSITLTSKGLDSKVVKILNIYTCIDFSSNFFKGPIPEEIGELTLLYVLNLSNNAFSGSIPSSFGELRHLESLDLSKNKLKGEIPTSLASLNFLSYVNFSFNQLIRRIPTGNQFQTFSDSSFWGNEGLCGYPLAKTCLDGVETPKHNHSRSGTEIDWNFLSAEIGFVVGFWSVVGSLVFCKRWRESYFESVIDVAFRIFPLAVTRKLLVLEN